MCLSGCYRSLSAPATTAEAAGQSETTVEETVCAAPMTTEPEMTDELLMLVNDRHPITKSYHPDLIRVEGEYQTTVDKRVVKDLKQMLRDCRKAGCSPLVCSSYRSLEKQTNLFNEKVRQYRVYSGLSESEAKKEAAVWVAYPGTSEHHTGLAVDIVDIRYQLLDEKQESTSTQQWLMKNCQKYGFILRYPVDKKAITHIQYEPWHYRYVGKENAQKIYESGLCLEEYLNKK